MAETFESKIERAATALQTPAGESPKFSSFDAIRENRDEFVIECHKTWKHWHGEAVREVLIFDAFAEREKQHPIGRGALEFANYNRALWRRVNDAIVWAVFGGQRHVVKRFCLYRDRNRLVENNAEVAMDAIAAMNANPLSLALWTDATSCVDIGDVLLVEDGRVPQPRFIELKSGKVNDEIFRFTQLEGEEAQAAIHAFISKYGKAGVKQFERMMRQHRTADQALELLAKDRGTDPVTGMEMEVIGIDVEEETYDETLNALLMQAIDGPTEVMELVAGCLWVYANGDPAFLRNAAIRRFRELLAARGVHPATADELDKVRADDKDRIVRLDWNVFHQMARPIFHRNLHPRVTASVMSGALLHKTLLYFDLGRFAECVTQAGATFAWASDKTVRRANAMRADIRPSTFKGRIPEMRMGSARMYLSDPNLVQMWFDGLTPRTIVKRSIAMEERIASAQ